MKNLCRFMEDNLNLIKKKEKIDAHLKRSVIWSVAVRNLAARGSSPIKISEYIEDVLILTETSIISLPKQISQRSTCVSKNVYTNVLKFEAI